MQTTCALSLDWMRVSQECVQEPISCVDISTKSEQHTCCKRDWVLKTVKRDPLLSTPSRIQSTRPEVPGTPTRSKRLPNLPEEGSACMAEKLDGGPRNVRNTREQEMKDSSSNLSRPGLATCPGPA